ncbi:MAG: hypothetical protein AAF907_15805, partial [Planctomycetota bacterium]
MRGNGAGSRVQLTPRRPAADAATAEAPPASPTDEAPSAGWRARFRKPRLRMPPAPKLANPFRRGRASRRESNTAPGAVAAHPTSPKPTL